MGVRFCRDVLSIYARSRYSRRKDGASIVDSAYMVICLPLKPAANKLRPDMKNKKASNSRHWLFCFLHVALMQAISLFGSHH